MSSEDGNGYDAGYDSGRESRDDEVDALKRELSAAIARAEAAEATVERCKQVCAATAEGWRETQAELDRLTTAAEKVIDRLQMDIDDGGRPDQWSMQSMVETLRAPIPAPKEVKP